MDILCGLMQQEEQWIAARSLETPVKIAKSW